jgi:hypothetical protein
LDEIKSKEIMNAVQKDITKRQIQTGRIRIHIYSPDAPVYSTLDVLVDAMIATPDNFYISGNNITNNFITHNTSKFIANKE